MPLPKTIPRSNFATPAFIYGTAWKEDRTEPLAVSALRAGFRGIDTANQRKHYHEAGVGNALTHFPALNRADLFIQTKYTFAAGQDHRLPYDPKADIATQVNQSFASSLEHLGISYIDSYLLHGPMYRDGLSPADWEAWRAMEIIQKSGAARLIGVSNFDVDQLRDLLDGAEVLPAFVQNRCYARTGWDREMRNLCAANGILYQGFSLLNANRAEMGMPAIANAAKRLGCSAARVVFRFAMQVGMIPLTGTSNEEHMKEDLGVYGIELTEEEVKAIEAMSG